MSTSSAAAAPTVRSARVSVAVASPTACEVSMELAVAGASAIDHRLQMFDGTRVELVTVHGAQQIGPLRTIGRTSSLVLQPVDLTYGFEYRIRQPDLRAYRCPIWLPAAPSDGQPGTVRIEAEIPVAMVPGRTMPAFTWNGVHGSATLTHIPAVALLPYRPAGEARGWSIARTMDALAIAICVAASAVWVWRARI